MTIEQIQTKLQAPLTQLKTILQQVSDEIAELDGKANPTDMQAEHLEALNEAEAYLIAAIDELESL